MARHNRDSEGEDQRGTRYTVGYQPDWFRQVKVTRDLESGRQSTKILFRNPDPPLQDPGERVRTQITSEELGIDVELAVRDPRRVVRRVLIETEVRDAEGGTETVVFAISNASASSREND